MSVRLALRLLPWMLIADAIWAASTSEQRMERRVNSLRSNPPELYAFLLKMPKGGDLHNHLGGAVYAEDLIESAAQQGLCVDTDTWSFVYPAAGRCEGRQMEAKAASQQNDARNHLIDSMSMRNFVPALESAHDHFFAAFAKFQPAGRAGNPTFLAQVVRRAAEQNESYLEMMALSGGAPLSNLSRRATWSDDFEIARAGLLKAGLPEVVSELKTRVDELEQKRLQMLNCQAGAGSAACRLEVRYIFQVQREFPKQQVFTQILAGFALAAADPRVVSVNLVQPEDGLTSMRDYHLHMQMLQYVRSLYPNVRLTLHAGELAPGLVPPDGLRFHIREAVKEVHAERIGHAVDLNYELNPPDILKTMAERRTAVEINLTSNDMILGVRGNDHPLPTYLKAGVPVVLCTDDEGVSRTHLTQEYLRATLTYNLTYSTLKQIARNSLEFSFLPGASFWITDSYQTPVPECKSSRTSEACRAFLSRSPKAKLQADLEERFAVFEKEF